MFDYLPRAEERTRSDPRLLAIRILSSSGARLALVASRIGGEAGAALAQALRDMMIDPTVDPMHWPIDEMLAMLRQPGARRDTQVDRLIASLSHLSRKIDAGPA